MDVKCALFSMLILLYENQYGIDRWEQWQKFITVMILENTIRKDDVSIGQCK